MKIETDRGMDGGSELILNKLRIGHWLIPTGNDYELRTGFQQRLKLMEKETQAQTIDAITSLDTINEPKTYEGGCAFLLDWFREKTLIAE